MCPSRLSFSPACVLLAFAFGCSEADTDTGIDVEISAGLVTLQLINPTTSAPDPLEDIETLRLEVLIGGEVIVTDSFDYPEESPDLVGLDEFGVVRFQIAGISNGQVRSFGRSAETVLVPEETVDLAITFLPINEVFSLDAEAYVKASEHAAQRLPNGTVALAGGHNASRSDTFDTISFFDPVTKTFSPSLVYLDSPVGRPESFLTKDGELVLVGGSEWLSPGGSTSVEVSSNVVQIYNPSDNSVREVASMGYARSNHCATRYLSSAFAVLGGEGTGDFVDIVKLGSDGDDEWTVTTVQLFHEGTNTFEDAHGCGVFSDGTIFIQGPDSDTTGLWDLADAGSTPGQTFVAYGSGDVNYVRHPIVWPIADDSMWVAGGVDVSSGQVTSDASEFQTDTMNFVTGQPLAAPRQRASVDEWIEEGWLVVGCGYDDSFSSPVGSVEFVAPRTGSTGFIADLDRSRPGCQVTTLLDGTVLVSGGYEPDDVITGSADAAILVPYLD